MSADTRRSQVAALRAEGLGPTTISRATGIPRSTVVRWIYPHLAEQSRTLSRDAKRRRVGKCVDCGAETKYDGRDVASRCVRCANVQSGLQQRGTGDVQRRALAFLAEPRRFSELRDYLGVNSSRWARRLRRAFGRRSRYYSRLLPYGLVVRGSRAG